eukprot:GHVU01118840.1.p1 GENE.GHVU01118840.1~~GHVU01118840.1.p1  ORF type:complete len:110 (-),score=5.36 GHVU01118840.1:127-456(-)
MSGSVVIDRGIEAAHSSSVRSQVRSGMRRGEGRGRQSEMPLSAVPWVGWTDWWIERGMTYPDPSYAAMRRGDQEQSVTPSITHTLAHPLPPPHTSSLPASLTQSLTHIP